MTVEAAAAEVRWRVMAASAADAAIMASTVAGELGLLVRFVSAPDEPAMPVLLHFVLAFAVGFYALRRYHAGCRRPQLFVFALSAATLGPIGAVGFVVQALLHALFRRSATPFETWYRSLFPELERDRTRILYETIALHRTNLPARSSVTPFLDVLAGGTVRQKQLMIGMIADQFRPAYAPILRRSLNDAEPAIRVQAATAVAKIETRFMDEAMELERALARSGDRQARLALVACYETYTGSGLLDPTRAQTLCRKALEVCDDALVQDPGDVECVAARGRLLVRLGRADEAVAMLRPLASGDNVAPRVLSGLCAALHACGRHHDLRRAASRLWYAQGGADSASQAAFWARPDLTEGGS